MNILLTNDDGFFANGLLELAKVLKDEHKITVIAPQKDMSGTSHCVHFFHGISFKQENNLFDNVECFSVDGTPADCVLFGTRHLLKNQKVDLVLSGINSVFNVGSDIIYSGTFGAAQEGTYLGYPAIAISLNAVNGDYSFSAQFIKKNLNLFMEYASDDYTLNVNIPFEKAEQIKGVKVGYIARRPYKQEFVEYVDEKGDKLFCVNGQPISQIDNELVYDVSLVENGYIAISAVKLIANHKKAVDNLSKARFCL